MTAHHPADASLTFTGERFLPEVRGAIWYEHWHRYAAVAPLAQGRRVLDAACGEGYGSWLLAKSAASVIGVDVSPAAVAHAGQRYKHPNLAFTTGSVAALPLPDASVDLVVSFETIEHLHEQAAMLAEFRRVLAPGGVLVISSPNRPVYNEGGGTENHYHVRELDRDELAALLGPVFPNQAWYAQRVLAQSVLWREGASQGTVDYATLRDDTPALAVEPAPPMYFVVVCAGAGVALPALPSLSLFDDGALSLWRDYVRALVRERELVWDEIAARKVAEERLAELIPALNDLASAREANAVMEARIAALEAELAHTQRRAQAAIDATERALAETQQALARETQAHAHTADAHARTGAALDEVRARLAYRESVRGWLRYPLAALRQRQGQ
ncbi:MAG: class I SAM-dependent methyltransferase [Burkholderiales bacterium]